LSGELPERGAEPAVVPYRRGIAAGQILKGVVSRFLPGSILGTGGLAVVLDLSARGGSLATVGVVVALAGGMTVGYGLSLFGARRWLFPDASPDRHRSFLAGLLAPLATFVGLAAGIDFAYLPGLSFAMGALVAVVLFFAWLAPTPAERRAPGFVDDPTP
jgi:hypothetical protein